MVHKILTTELPYIRRLKKDVALQLPRKIRTRLPLEVEALQASATLRLVAEEFARKRGFDPKQFDTPEALVEFVLTAYRRPL